MAFSTRARCLTESETNQSEQQFLKLTQLGGGGCLGLMFGFIASIESINPRVSFSLNWMVPVGFVGGGLIVWWILGRIFAAAQNPEAKGGGKRKPLFWMLFFCFLTVGLTLAGFIWSLQDTPSSRMKDVIIGNAIALWVVGFGCLLVWNLIQYFEENSAEAERKFNEEHGVSPAKDSE